ncbi:tRNA (guanine(9)-N(1))-methyltransferase [Aspergillus clavatus NRRL 1]|uniref:tRNA (guanine(9)-N1)-methyltransferase n=1 Tax=Aspergillus clavatus (strain ATCC 1007 / CBS 513.65 / DSM 816 / NCTC 3887 / NRRL 1 / QM 1276 / 107) TaxID=344612 RepID=A1CJZ5_ASPCL|nr:tRNA m(1)G methyltransferase domain containing protein [Aspergillus clavatus NRRL 1]EAW09469.1 tRNA m(1)G methyltransferase domain containing protein [Aspergillus clavatus NRRL 1]
MEDDERPRKYPKLNHDNEREESEPAMTGAVGVACDSNAEITDADKNTSTSDGGMDDTAEQADAEAEHEEGKEAVPTMSKNQLKKLRRKEQWESMREQRKVKRKEKLVARKERKRAARDQAKEDGAGAVDEAGKALEAIPKRHQRSTLLPITLVIDCGYDDLMLDKERVSLAAQITRSYSDNSRAPYRAHFVISSFDKLLKERFDTVLRKTHENWRGVRILQEDFAEAAEQSKECMQGPQGGKLAGVFADQPDAKPEDGEIVYLSSDSPNTLTELKPYSTYIIGGLVDKNRHKAVCYKSAVAKGMKTAKLPIGEYIQMSHRQVLATNHVVEIMVRWLELRDWGKAFIQVIPPRKGGKLRSMEDESEGQTSTPQENYSDREEVAEDTVDPEQQS